MRTTIVALALAAITATARAEDAPELVETLALARLCVHEAGFGRQVSGVWVPPRDCAAIDAVIERVQRAMSRAQHREVSYVEAMRRYSPSVFDQTRTDSQQWAPRLDVEGVEPVGWPARVAWSSRRTAWFAVLDYAARIRADVATHTCAAPPHHWGCGDAQIAAGCGDHERAMLHGMELVACAGVTGRFYRVPRLARFDGAR